MDGLKTCCRCGKTKPLDAFSPHPRTRDRRQSHCKACHSLIDRKSRRINTCADCSAAIDRNAIRCLSCSKTGEQHPRWKGGRRRDATSGYILLRIDGKSIPEHRYKMEKLIGRPLKSHETVHHKNGVRDDNRIENLELWSTSQPSGQRVEDKIRWAREFLALYG